MAYLTPGIPTFDVLVTIAVPDTMLPFFWGALLAPSDESEWEPGGELSIHGACQIVERWQEPYVGIGFDLENSPYLLDSALDVLTDDTGAWITE